MLQKRNLPPLCSRPRAEVQVKDPKRMEKKNEMNDAKPSERKYSYLLCSHCKNKGRWTCDRIVMGKRSKGKKRVEPRNPRSLNQWIGDDHFPRNQSMKTSNKLRSGSCREMVTQAKNLIGYLWEREPPATNTFREREKARGNWRGGRRVKIRDLQWTKSRGRAEKEARERSTLRAPIWPRHLFGLRRANPLDSPTTCHWIT